MKFNKFLHDISSPVSGVEFILDAVENDLKQPLDPALIQEKINIAFEGLKKIRRLINQAREEMGNE